MPKIAPFFLFMQEKKKVLRNINGKSLTNIELQQECGKLWSQMTDEEKKVYKKKAKRETDERKEEKYDTTGIPFSRIERDERNAKNYEKEMISYIKSWLAALHDGDGIKKGVFYILSVLNYVEEPSKTIPAEIGMVKVSFEHGIIDEFHYLFNASIIPNGWAATALDVSTNTHLLPTTIRSRKLIDFEDFTTRFFSFIQNEGTEAPVYCCWRNYKIIRKSFENIDDVLEKVKIYSLSLLFTEILHFAQLPPLHAPVLDILSSSEYDYEPYTGCQWHQTKYIDGLNHCPLGKAQRWVYIMCATLRIKETYKVNLLAYNHKPGKKGSDLADFNKLTISAPPKETNKVTKPKWGSRPIGNGNSSYETDKVNFSCDEQFPALGASVERKMMGVASAKKTEKSGVGRGRKNVKG